MTKISNKTKCKIMNSLLSGQDVSKLAKENGVSDKMLNSYINELNLITNGNEDVGKITKSASRKEIFNNYCWNVIDKANEILITKLNLLSEREENIDKILNQIESQLSEDTYDKTQMAKLIKLLDGVKNNNLSELARIIQIMYDRTNESDVDTQSEKSLEDIINDISGDNF